MFAVLVVTANLVAAIAPVEDARCTSTPESLRVRLSIASEVFKPAADIIKGIVEEVWRPEGITVVWDDDAVRHADVDFWIAALHGMKKAADGGALGLVQFDRGVPTRLARLSIDAAVVWVRRYRSAVLNAAPAALRASDDVPLVNLALGYAAAHEIGHFVLATGRHAASGVMQATYRHPGELREKSVWTLDNNSRRRLQQRLAEARTCAAASAGRRDP